MQEVTTHFPTAVCANKGQKLLTCDARRIEATFCGARSPSGEKLRVRPHTLPGDCQLGVLSFLEREGEATEDAQPGVKPQDWKMFALSSVGSGNPKVWRSFLPTERRNSPKIRFCSEQAKK
ncbi:hypothetical protein CHARACLAT_000324 [Characodon lateralis]|uniref:Uncharacterized protein n=1 Tax=Characodon lateralis TaxID=208331 RepID=A0ABU7CVU1_9TELE|nr:hypothetical protein [Characodon lateralis]